MHHVYMDYNASTPLSPNVKNVLSYWMDRSYGNPSASHWAGKEAKQAVETARTRLAAFIGAEPEEVIFTSGGTESNNYVLKGVYENCGNKPCHIITTTIEHPAVLEPCRYLEKMGASVTYIGTDSYGRVNPLDIEAAITRDTALISVMHANNETGTLQPIEEISEVARRFSIPFHTDASQSLGKVPVNVDELGIDFLTIAGHKMYAPKGIGALYMRKTDALPPLLHGASHESGRRAGTENVLFTAALGEACMDAASIDMTAVKRRRDLFWELLQQNFPLRVHRNGHPVHTLPNTLHVRFTGITGEDLLKQMPFLAASTGAACHSGSVELSATLQALGLTEQEGAGSVRFSLGSYSTDEDVFAVIEALKTILT